MLPIRIKAKFDSDACNVFFASELIRVEVGHSSCKKLKLN